MTYQVLARKCRPQRFSEIVGQQHITRTLQNAISQNRVGHAYLFVGSRGIGKTTTARIFAKALNCESGIVTEPCCECRSCQEISKGASLDVIEIDGASHNKVEHVRDLRENVQYAPSRSRYKIYIIDEVHMLTSQAWNALLKTLEEPPSHVKFFFATTEPHKVLSTIVSRCQRFDLKRIPVSLIAGRLAEIASTENVNIDERALVAIARAADGAMRDAQSIFDQIIAFCGTGEETKAIQEEDVISVFGLASGSELQQLAAALLDNSVQQAVQIIHELADRGRDLERLYADLVYFVRSLMICQLCPEPAALLDASETEMADLKELVARADTHTVQNMLEGLVAEERALRSALNKRVYLEVALVRVMRDAHSVDINDVIDRLNQFRKRGDGGPSSSAAVKNDVNAGAGPDVSVPESRPPSDQSQPPSEMERRAPEAETLKQGAAPSVAAEETEESAADEVPSAGQSGETSQKPATSLSPTPLAEADESHGNVGTSAEESPPKEEHAPDKTAEKATAGAPAPEPETGDAQTAAISADDVKTLWKAVVKGLTADPEKRALTVPLQHLRPVSFADGVLQVAYDDEFPQDNLRALQRRDTLASLEKVLSDLSGVAAAKILFKRWIEGISNQDDKKRLVSSAEVRERVETNAFVRQVLDMFGGEIIDVRG
ncbi:MAG: DNA polymerase III subunit gamma/tau [Candidatus Pacebacteria bacterium]|nr:DNA polymerase III subunit gamma/tau [Candidatus Paceibacterota bacterium]